MGFVAQQSRPFGAQHGRAAHDFTVVVFSAAVAPAHGGRQHALPQVAVFQCRHERLLGGVDHGDHEPAGQLPRFRLVRSPLDLCLGQARKLLAGVDHREHRIDLVEHILAELGLKLRQFRIDGPQPFLLLFGEFGAGTDELAMGLFHEAQRFGVEVQRLAIVVEGLDALEQRAVEQDAVAVRGQLRRDLHLDCLHLVVGMRRHQAEENARDTVQNLARQFHRYQRVPDRGRLVLIDDGVDLRQVLGHAGFERRQVVAVVDPVERRILQKQGAFNEKRVIAGHGF